MFRSIVINSVKYNLRDNIEDYTEMEKSTIKKGFESLEVKAQGAELSIEETALRVAWHRLLREENFFIVQAKPKKTPAAGTRKKKVVAELSVDDYLEGLDYIGTTPSVKEKAKPVKAARSTEKTAEKEISMETANRHRAQTIAFRKNSGEEVTPEEEAFLAEELKKLEELLQ